MIYVNMTDKFLSGWGEARGGRAAYCIKCDTYEQAEAIVAAAERRPEMKRIAIADRPRKAAQVTIKHVSQLGGPWLQFMPREATQ